MGRIGVIADAHGNLPATVASLDALVHCGCETVVHVGDAVGIGPHPSEVVSLLLERRTVCLMGNHDEWLAFGVPEPRPPWMSEGEAEHHRWVRAQLSAAQRSAVRGWPYEVAIRLGERTVVFVHYARRHGQFSYLAHPTGAELGKSTSGSVAMWSCSATTTVHTT